METDLNRFIEAQATTYDTALEEIKEGRKISHWMWYIFPQYKGLGNSEFAKFYALQNMSEATAYLHHPILGARLKEISNTLLKLEQKDPTFIFGHPDDMKLKSCMTLFSKVEIGDETIFTKIINQFFEGDFDRNTLILIREH